MQIEDIEKDGIARLNREVSQLLSDMRRGDAIRTIQNFVERIIFDPASVAKVFASAELDDLCKTIGTTPQQSKGAVPDEDGGIDRTDNGGTIILVSELSRAGGHNELIRDIIRLNLFVAPTCIVQTDCFERSDKDLCQAFSNEVGVPVHQVPSESLDEKFNWIGQFIGAKHPKNLLLLAHNQDSLAISCAFAARSLFPDVSVVYIHHGDHHLSLGAATKDFIHVDPHNIGYFHCRHQLGNQWNRYWPLTVNGDAESDPRTNFITTDVLTTCSSGRSEKFDAHSYLYDYFDLIPQILDETHGVHVHIGPLMEKQLERVRLALETRGIGVDRFVHVPWVKSLAQALSQYKVDLYISSFPLGGGKATLEAMAAGIPLLMHESYRSRFHGGVDISYPGAFVWKTPEELFAILRVVDARSLCEQSVLAVNHYRKFHSEKILAAACKFDIPQDESLIPELHAYEGNAVESFLDDQRNLKLKQELEITPLQEALHSRVSENSRLLEMVREKDRLLFSTGESLHRLEGVVESKDSRLRSVGEQLEVSRSTLSAKEAEYAKYTEHMKKIVVQLESAQVELSQMSEMTEKFNEKVVELSHYQSLVADLDQKLVKTGLDLAAMTEKAAKVSADIAEFGAYPVRIRSIEKELAAAIDGSEQQRHYFYAEVDKRDKLLNDAQLRQEHLHLELRNSLDALATLQRTRWFRLRQILIAQPFGVREAALAAVTVAGGIVPHGVRSRWGSRLRQAFGLASNTDEGSTLRKAAGAYAVKLGAMPPSDAPKIVHALANFMTGGSSRLVVDLVEHLGMRYRQSVLTSFNPNPPAYTGLDIDEYSQPASFDALLQYFEKTKPDIVHVHYWGDCDEPWYSTVFEAARQLGIPIVENINTPVAPYLCDAVRRYVYVSDYVRSVFGKPEAHHVTVYPGSDFDMFTRLPHERAPHDCVGMVYRLENDKLNPDAIQPFIQIAKLRPQTRILIVGGGSLLEPFKASTEAAGVAEHFEFTGYVPYEALPELYRRMSVFIAPIWKESFGQVAPFAMSMKVPVIGYDVGAIGEIIGNSDLLATPADANQLARIAVRLLDSSAERQSIADFQQERAVRRFSVQAMIECYSGIYSEVVTSSKESL